MNGTVELHNHDHQNEYVEGIPSGAVTIVAGTCSLLFGLVAVLTNSILLFTLYKDPYNYFRTRSTTYFVASLCISDFLGGCFVQPLYSVCMFSIAAKIEQQKLCDTSLIFSHVATKISILTVVALSLDRFLAVKLSWKYKSLITVRKVVACDILIWLFCVIFEASHSTGQSQEIFLAIDLHLQTTVPLTIMFALYTATYVEFRRRSSRNVIFVQATTSGRPRVFARNIRLEKKIVLTVVFIIIVLFISLLPYLIANNLEDHCHEEGSSECDELGFVVTRAMSVPMLCVSCALNPFLYAWRIPQYRQALQVVRSRVCRMFRRQSRATSALALNIPTVLASASIVEQNTPAVSDPQQKRDGL